jgi:hypothetical protein
MLGEPTPELTQTERTQRGCSTCQCKVSSAASAVPFIGQVSSDDHPDDSRMCHWHHITSTKDTTRKSGVPPGREAAAT